MVRSRSRRLSGPAVGGVRPGDRRAGRSTAGSTSTPASVATIATSDVPADAPLVDDAEIGLTSDAGAMLAYTSGTTSSPKAALLSHRALIQVVRGAADELATSADDAIPKQPPAAPAVAANPTTQPFANAGTLATFDVRSEGLAPFGPF